MPSRPLLRIIVKRRRANMAVTLSEAAAKHVADFLSNRGKGVGVRIGVKTSGCSGLGYVLEFVDETQPEDIVFASHGVNVIVDPKSLSYLEGTEMDFVKEGLNEGFKFTNPNKKGECGCGESFSV
jgi:iron-sulfur cluster assembly protein